ncbi:histidine phosphatase family protein [Bhargavaea cecembensis]|uniref:histidine phosphatase family protein n=2 Tax=Bhargavaea cecembensis TaxID=394098 RepID=UPI00058E888B|nr:histidine phosphatase family protein [Bhargavaea cecembensis]
MDRPFVLYLIRHLETAANRERRYVGWTDVPVCVKADPASFEADVIAGSDLVRCRETARLLFPGAAYEAMPEFRECLFGEWEMKTYDDLKGDARYRKWIDDPFSGKPPGGERFGDMEARVRAGLMRLKAHPGHSAAVVTHGGPVRLLLAELAPDERPFFDRAVPPGSVYRLEWKDRQDWEEGKRCTSMSAVPITGSGTS